MNKEISKCNSCVNIGFSKYDSNIPMSWNYGSFNPNSNFYSRTNLHKDKEFEQSRAQLSEMPASPPTRELRYSDDEFTRALKNMNEKEWTRSRDKFEDPVRISKDGSHSASRVINVLKKIKSPKQIKIPKETEDLIDKVIRK